MWPQPCAPHQRLVHSPSSPPVGLPARRHGWLPPRCSETQVPSICSPSSHQSSPESFSLPPHRRSASSSLETGQPSPDLVAPSSHLPDPPRPPASRFTGAAAPPCLARSRRDRGAGRAQPPRGPPGPIPSREAQLQQRPSPAPGPPCTRPSAHSSPQPAQFASVSPGQAHG